MALFKVGDEVAILCTVVPGTHRVIPHGTKGKIDTALDGDHYPYRVSYVDSLHGRRHHIHTNWFKECDLGIPASMVSPMFDLDDIELAEIIIKDLKK